MNATMSLEKIDHFPVMLDQILSIITPQHGGTFIDCTFGAGGYSNTAISSQPINPLPINDFNNQNSIQGATALKMDSELKEENITQEKESIDSKEKDVSEISLDSIGYIESTQTNEIEKNQALADISTTENNEENEENEQSAPQLFSEDENIGSFKQEIDSEKDVESLIDNDEEEDFEIPAFLRKQKN